MHQNRIFMKTDVVTAMAVAACAAALLALAGCDALPARALTPNVTMDGTGTPNGEGATPVPRRSPP